MLQPDLTARRDDSTDGTKAQQGRKNPLQFQAAQSEQRKQREQTNADIECTLRDAQGTGIKVKHALGVNGVAHQPNDAEQTAKPEHALSTRRREQIHRRFIPAKPESSKSYASDLPEHTDTLNHY